MIGTIVNTGTILAGSLLGSLLRKGIQEKFRNALYTAMGLAATGLSTPWCRTCPTVPFRCCSS